MNKNTIIKQNSKEANISFFWENVRAITSLKEKGVQLTLFQESFLKVDPKLFEYCDNYVVEGVVIKTDDLVEGTLAIQNTIGGKTSVRVFNKDDEEIYRQML